MSKKKRPRRRSDTGSIIDSIKTLIIEGIHLYDKIKPLIKRRKTRKTKGKTKTQKPKSRRKKNDSSEISNQ